MTASSSLSATCTSAGAVARAKSYVDDVEFSPEDGYRSDPDFMCEVCQLAVDNVRLINWDQPGCDYLQGGGPIRQSTLSPRVREAAGVPVIESTLPVTTPAALPAGQPARLAD